MNSQGYHSAPPTGTAAAQPPASPRAWIGRVPAQALSGSRLALFQHLIYSYLEDSARCTSQLAEPAHCCLQCSLDCWMNIDDNKLMATKQQDHATGVRSAMHSALQAQDRDHPRVHSHVRRLCRTCWLLISPEGDDGVLWRKAPVEGRAVGKAVAGDLSATLVMPGNLPTTGLWPYLNRHQQLTGLAPWTDAQPCWQTEAFWRHEPGQAMSAHGSSNQQTAKRSDATRSYEIPCMVDHPHRLQ